MEDIRVWPPVSDDEDAEDLKRQADIFFEYVNKSCATCTRFTKAQVWDWEEKKKGKQWKFDYGYSCSLLTNRGRMVFMHGIDPREVYCEEYQPKERREG